MSFIYIPERPPAGQKKGLTFANYLTTTSVRLSPGSVEANGKKYQTDSPVDHVLTLASPFAFYYIYLDVSESSSGNIVVYDSVSEPVKDLIRKGWYHPSNTEDRLLELAPSKDASTTMEYFSNFQVGDNQVRSEINSNAFQIALNMTPSGAWQTPSEQESGYYTPVNAVAVMVKMFNTDPTTVLKMSWKNNEAAAVNTDIYEAMTRLTGYDEATFSAWGPLGASRNIKVGGEPDDNPELQAWIGGYQYEI